MDSELVASVWPGADLATLAGAARAVHIAAGFGGLALGLAAMTVPKFGRSALWHVGIGRGYAACMLVSAGLSIPLAVRLGNPTLLVIGVLTVPAVAGGWLAARQARSAPEEARSRWLRGHVVLIGSSYIAAWTAFLINVPVFGLSPRWLWFVYLFGPTVIGTVLIARASRRLRRGNLRQRASTPTEREAAGEA